jgi:hypothetical protein
MEVSFEVEAALDVIVLKLCVQLPAREFSFFFFLLFSLLLGKNLVAIHLCADLQLPYVKGCFL